MIRVIVTDLDDTLLRYDKTISNYTIQILKKCREKGIKLIFATARSESAKQLVPFELFDGYILMNGAAAIADGTKIYEKQVIPSVFGPFLDKINSLNMQAAAEINGVHYSNFIVPDRKYIITDFVTIKEKIEKFYVIVDSQDKVEIVKNLLPEGLSVHFTKDHYALITHSEALKINALTSLLEHWNISYNNAVAFGDDVNDIDMIKKCGIGIAMANALDEIKDIADEICDECEKDGVAKWLSKRIFADTAEKIL